MNKMSSDDLDKFLAMQGEKPAVNTLPVVNTQPVQQNPIQSATSLVQQGNNGLGNVTELFKVINDLIKNGSDLFGNLDRKEERLNLNGGGYTDSVKQKMQLKPEPTVEGVKSSLEMSYTESSNRIVEWFDQTLEALPKEMTTEQILEQWRTNKRSFVSLISDLIKGKGVDEKLVKQQSVKPKQKDISYDAENVDKPQSYQSLVKERKNLSKNTIKKLGSTAQNKKKENNTNDTSSK